MGRIAKRHMREARPEDVRRLARWLNIRHIDTMSHRQLISLLDWLFRRPQQRMRGMASTW